MPDAKVPPMRVIAYGSLPDQVGDLYLPAGGSNGAGANRAVICLLHGGFWRVRYGREYIAPLALDLARRGFAVWNLEYRRVGTPGGGWPGTLDDVAAGIDYLAALAVRGEPIDTAQVTAVGHSAGGHLALWAAQRRAARRVRIAAAVGLAAVSDLRLAYERHLSHGAVEDFMGGTPDGVAERYRAASPAELLPLGVRQLLIHGTLDEDVPVEISRRYVATARAAGDTVSYIELATARHMDLVDPHCEAHAAMCRWLRDPADSFANMS
jgi:acetyl esterase/lipase